MPVIVPRQTLETVSERIIGAKARVNSSVNEVYVTCCLIMEIFAARTPAFLLYDKRYKSLLTASSTDSVRDKNYSENTLKSLAMCGFYAAQDKNGAHSIQCFYCSLKYTPKKAVSSIEEAARFHVTNSPRCFVCKLYQCITDTSKLPAEQQDDVVKSVKAWKVILKHLTDVDYIKCITSYGFDIITVRIAVFRHFINLSGKIPKHGDAISMIYKECEPYSDFMNMDGIKDILDPLILIESLLKQVSEPRYVTEQRQTQIEARLNVKHDPVHTAQSVRDASLSKKGGTIVVSSSKSTSSSSDSGIGSSLPSSSSKSLSSRKSGTSSGCKTLPLNSIPELSSNNSSLAESGKSQIVVKPPMVKEIGGYCTHSEEVKKMNSKGLVLIPCQHLVRCPTCLASPELTEKLLCPRCGHKTMGGLICYIP